VHGNGLVAAQAEKIGDLLCLRFKYKYSYRRRYQYRHSRDADLLVKELLIRVGAKQRLRNDAYQHRVEEASQFWQRSVLADEVRVRSRLVTLLTAVSPSLAPRHARRLDKCKSMQKDGENCYSY
jgi:hypothetical protein